MVAVRFVFGVGGAMWVTLMGSVVLAAVKAERRPFANSLNAIAVNIGVVTALFVTLPLAQSIGARPALTVACVAIALCFVVLLALGDLGGATKPMPVVDTLRAYRMTLAVPTTWILALAFCGPLALYLVLNTFLATHLEAQFQISRADSMRWLSFMNLWGVPSSLLAGLMLARVHAGPRPYLVVASLLVPAAVVGAVLVDDSAARALCFALAGFGLFLPTAPLVTAVQKLPGQTPEKLAMVFGTMFAVTYLASAAVPTLVGALVAGGTPLATALVGAAVLGASPLVGLALPRHPAG
jgi:predicted MFS family arabinose efflux permease